VLANLRNKGYRPTDFTVSIFEGEKSVAHSLEKRLIKKLRPVLNHMSVQPHSHTALTEQEVRDIRVKYASGAVSQGTLAKAYGVAQPTVHAIVSRRTWAHI
jgi:DNA-binding MarR family transcriptional regulator